jgi:uroporphyrinogen-III decarboxylase
MEMDFISIPLTLSEGSVFGYRMFNPSEIREAAESGLFVLAVVDGPFQMLVNRMGLRRALADIASRIDEVSETVNNEAKQVSSLVETCIHYGANAVMIAEQSPVHRIQGAHEYHPQLWRFRSLPFVWRYHWRNT